MELAKEQKKILKAAITEACSHREFLSDPKRDFTRDRKLPLESMLNIIISMQSQSILRELRDNFNKKDITTSAFIQQREKISYKMFEHIFDTYNETYDDAKTYKGYRLFAIDGSDINIAKDENSDSYMENGSNEGFNQLHLNILYDLMNCTYQNCIFQPRPSCNEIKACCDIINKHEFKKSILIADRGYGSQNLLEKINRTPGLDYLFRVKNGWINETKNLPMEDLDRDISFELRTTQTKEDKILFAQGKARWVCGPSKFGKSKRYVEWEFESPFTMKLRVVRFEISDGNYETIVTSLDRDEFPLDEIKELYNKRWGIETSFRELKYNIGLVYFHARKENSILQEIFAKLIIYNFCERIMKKVDIPQSEKRKYEYQANHAHAMHECRKFFRNDNIKPSELYRTIRDTILPVRPGRKFKRRKIPKSFVPFAYRAS